MAKIIKSIYQFKRGTAQRWTEVNPVLHQGEPGFEYDTGKLKIGDGSTTWLGLPYINDVEESSEAFKFKGTAGSISEDGSTIYDAKGTAIENISIGDVYQIGEKEYAYNGEVWVELGFNVDLTEYVKHTDINQSYDPTSENAQSGKAVKEAVEPKLDKPEIAPEVGKVLKVKSVNEDGTFICEWAEVASGTEEWEEVMTYSTTADDENASAVGFDFTNGKPYKKLFVIIDESGIDRTDYMSVRFGVRAKRTSDNVTKNQYVNTSPAFSTTRKYKTFYAESVGSSLFLYRATSEQQLYGYVSPPLVGQAFNEGEDYTKFYGICWYGRMYEGTKITIYGVRK